MSSREPMWFCHECHSEMHPLMVPDPVCASCHGSFVEKMDNAADDPRHFVHPLPEGPEDIISSGVDTFLSSLQQLVDGGSRGDQPRSSNQNFRAGASGPRLSFQLRTSSNVQGSDHIPTLSEFVRRGPEMNDSPTISGPLMAQYLMALLSHREPLHDMFGGGMNDLVSGRMGDYVFNQDALEQIMTQLMENSNANRPVPATEEIILNLSREVLEDGSPLLEKDCAVCKEQFKLETEDPDEQVVVTLPCKHPFHAPCILPWLKSSGTCPVCRHALVPQTEHRSPQPPSDSNSNFRTHERSSSRDANTIFQSLFGGLTGAGGNVYGNSTGSTSQHPRTSDLNSRASDRRNNDDPPLPGSWEDDLD